MVFNIFTVRFIRVTEICEAIKSSKPVFLCTTARRLVLLRLKPQG